MIPSTCVAWLALGLMLWIVAALSLPLLGMAMSSWNDEGETDHPCIVVLGCLFHPVSGEPGPLIRQRVATTVALVSRLKGDSSSMLVFTGGMLEAERSARLFEELGGKRYGVHVVLENQSRTTWENLLFTMPLVRDRCGAITIVSDAFHIPRVWMLFQVLYPTTRVRFVATEEIGNYAVYFYWCVREVAAIIKNVYTVARAKV